MPSPEKHAVLSASGADCWLHCPGSIKLSEGQPDKSSKSAEEGRLAHALAELKLRKLFGIDAPMSQRTYNTRLNKLKKDPLYKPEMDRCTDVYRDYIADLANSLPGRPYVGVERLVHYSAFAPDGFGTADCILHYGPDLFVNDYKHGMGVPVSAEHNPQLMLYAVGAVWEYRAFCDFQTIHLAIIQPRAGGVKEWSLSRDELIDWATLVVRPAAEKAMAGVEEFHYGSWCRWCKAKPFCREHAANAINAVEDFMPRLPPKLSPEELGELLRKLDPLQQYAKAAREYAESTLLQGGTIPGWKLVEVRKSREWDDQDAAFKALQAAGVDEALLWRREPCSLAQLEKNIGKKAFQEAVGSHVVRRPGKPGLAPVEDPREAYSARPTVQEDFQEPA